jgi:hypothetical protein
MPNCDVCHEPLEHKACAVVDLAAAARRAARTRQWFEDGKPGPAPPLIAWQLIHVACDPDRDWRLSYVVGCSSLRSDLGLLRQTLRVSRQPWYRQVNWVGLVKRILDQNPRGG